MFVGKPCYMIWFFRLKHGKTSAQELHKSKNTKPHQQVYKEILLIYSDISVARFCCKFNSGILNADKTR